MLMVPDRAARTYDPRTLVGRYFAQRSALSDVSALSNWLAVTYRPGGYTGSFKGRTILPVGSATKFVLSYDETPTNRDKPKATIPFKGYRAIVRRNGLIDYESGGPCLHLDLSRRPRPGVGGRVFDPERNPSLLDTALRMDKACKLAVASRRRLPGEPITPRTLLEFAASNLPPFQDTPFLRTLTAESLGVAVQELGANGEVLLSRLLHDVWEQAIVRPSDSNGAVMLDARLCPGASGFLRAYEDFSQLLGVPTWNPARDVPPAFHPNPALDVLREVGLGLKPDFESPIGDDLIREMLLKMRARVEHLPARFTDEDLLDAVTAYSGPLVAWSEVLPRLRARLPVWADECCEDEDLRRAALRPAEPLWVRYACRVQVYYRATMCSGSAVPLNADAQYATNLLAAG
jgi:hypothetical protein